MIEPRPIQQADRTFVQAGRRKLSYFAGCDYFRLASDPRVLEALQNNLDEFGLNVSASRLTTGNHVLYGKLEKVLKDFFEVEDALCVSSGYLGNLVVAQGLAGEYSHVLLDERAHTSLVDAAQFFDCPVLRFKHRDVDDYARALARCGKAARVVVLTDGMFSHDGSAAPLEEYARLLPRDGLMVVDDAHGVGPLGEKSRGAVEHTGISRRRVVQTTTLSKAFGVYGGVILGTRELRDKILRKSRAFVGNTPLPLPLVGAAITAITIVKRDAAMCRRLKRNALRVKTALHEAGFLLPKNPGPIVPVIPVSAEAEARLRAELLKRKVFPSFIRYPGGPAAGYYRFVISSEHTEGQLNDLAGAIGAWWNGKANGGRSGALRSKG